MTGPGLDVFTFGETMVSLRSAGPLAAGGALSMHVAGAESNVAVALARLGHRSAWGGRIGGDELGEFVLRRLRGEGVGTEDVVVDPERPTGLMFLEQRTADVTRVQYHRARSAGSALSADDLRGPLAAGARVLHLTGITPALSGSAREATLWAAGAASATGVAVCLDVNYRARLWPRDEARSVLAPLAAHASIVVASHDELDLVGPPGADEAAVVAGLRRAGTDTVLVKLGAAGARVHTRDHVHHAEAVAATAVDTVGAGDAFTAGYLSGRLDGLDAVGCLRRAVTLGAFAVSTRGDWEGLPRRDELSLVHGESGSTIR
ncbi:sugar kinase [Dactylosporangium sp. CA-139114]|uniref:sugar kinase n=1 Tax=Dactylosporangium sp. CA-139114 TaxID=3239931 RepID=UPI003D998844